MAEYRSKPMLLQEKDIGGLTELILKVEYYKAKAEFFEKLYKGKSVFRNIPA